MVSTSQKPRLALLGSLNPEIRGFEINVSHLARGADSDSGPYPAQGETRRVIPWP